MVYFWGLLRLLWFTWGLRVVYIAFLLVVGVVLGWGRMVAEATFFMVLLKFYIAKLFHIMIIWYICRNKTMNMAKVIHVHLLHNIDGTRRKDWYFSSISAVYTVLTAEQIGATKNYLLHAGLSGNGTLCTKRAIIKQSTLISCSRGADD